VRVRLRNPDRELEVVGRRPLRNVLEELGIASDTVLVIRQGELITRDTRVAEALADEVLPVELFEGAAP
jgi:sulfur carrier protein ThiS